MDFIDIAFDEYPEKHYVKEEVKYSRIYQVTGMCICSNIYGFYIYVLNIILFYFIQDCRYFKSKKTDRGPLKEGWKVSMNYYK